MANEGGYLPTEQQAAGSRIMFLVTAVFACFAVLFLFFVVLHGAEWADNIEYVSGWRSPDE